MTTETYFVTDMEADGPIPGPYSMRSVASVAYDPAGRLLGQFSVNLQPIPGAATHPITMKWWQGFPEAWAACQVDAREPAVGMAEYAAWVATFPGKAVFVGFPAGFDFMWVQWYLVRFVERTPFMFSALDIKTLVMLWLGSGYSEAYKSQLPPEWTVGLPHTHVALDDAREQGELFVQLMRGLRGRLAQSRSKDGAGSADG